MTHFRTPRTQDQANSISCIATLIAIALVFATAGAAFSFGWSLFS